MTWSQLDMPRAACAALLALLPLSLSACDVDPGVDDVRYECSSSAQCGEGYECMTDPSIQRMVCVPEGTTFADAGADAADGGEDATDDGGDTGCGPTGCPGEFVAVRVNMSAPFERGDELPELHAHPDGDLLFSGVFKTCITFNYEGNCPDSPNPRLSSTNAYDGFVARVGADGSVPVLHRAQVGTSLYDVTQMLAETTVLSDGTWVAGGIQWDGIASDPAAYNSASIPFASNKPASSIAHQAWIVRADDEGYDWATKFGWRNNDGIRQIDSNASDQIMLGGEFKERIYKVPQDSEAPSVDAATIGVRDVYVQRWNADGTAEAMLRLQSADDVKLDVAALADDGAIAATGEFEGDLEPYYDAFETGFSEFSTTPTRSDFSASEPGARRFLMVQPPDGSEPVIHEIGARGSIEFMEAGFDGNGDLVAVGGYASEADFGDGPVSSNDFAGAFLARWNPDDLSIVDLVQFDSDSNSDVFTSWDVGPQGGYMVTGQYRGDITYKQTEFTGSGDLDGLIAEFDDGGNIVWHKVIDSEGDVFVADAAVLADGRVAALVELPDKVTLDGQEYGGTELTTTWIFIFDPPMP